MKKILATILAAVASGAVLADQGSILATFSTKGPDCYADGTVVKDGESYALVWTLTNAVFKGISVDGKAVGSQDDNRVLCIAPLAKGGRCPDVVVEVPAVLADRYAGAGTFSLHLLDTRRADGTPGGVSAGVNGYGAAESFKLSASEQLQGATSANASLAENATVLPASIPQPKIKSIEVKDGVVRLTVERTSKLVRYGVSSGDTPANLKSDADFAPQDGNDAGDIVITAPAKGTSGFFSVGRAPLK